MKEKEKGDLETKEPEQLALYKEIVDHSHAEIREVRSEYKRLNLLIAILIAIGMWFTYKSARDFKEETRNNINELKTQVTKRVDVELGTEGIRRLIKHRVSIRIDEVADSLIREQVRDHIDPLIKDANTKLSLLQDELEKVRDRALLTELADRAIAESSRNAFDKLEDISENSEEGSPLRMASDAECLRVMSFWAKMQKEPENKPLKKSDGTEIPSSEFTTKELIAMLLKDDRWDVRRQAANWLAKREEVDVCDALVECLKTEKDIEVVHNALSSFKGLTRQDFGLLQYQKAIDWWEENRDSVRDQLQKSNENE